MRGQDKQSNEQTPGVPSPKPRQGGGRAAGGPSAGLLALQRSAGNAAVSRAVAEERHRHDASCGHLPAGPASPSVQRSAVHQVLRSAGRPLDAPLRTEMEARLGADFGDVRLHTDAVAQRSAAEVGARAYTSGSHVVVGRDGADKHTLAHELTHVVQQRRGPVSGHDNGSGLKVSDPADRFEREAEANARRVMSGAAPARAGAEGAHGGRRAVDTGAPQVQRATETEEAAPAPAAAPGFRQTRETDAKDRDVTLRMLDRMSRIALQTIVDTNGDFLDRKRKNVARSAKKITPHLAVSLLPDGRLAIAGNTGDKKVTANDKQVVEAELRLYIDKSDEVQQAKAATRNRNVDPRANKDRLKFRAQVDGSYAGAHGGAAGLLAIDEALRKPVQWFADGVESAKGTSLHGEMTVLGKHVEHWLANPRKGEATVETVMMGGVKKACRGCQWAFDAVNEYIGRPNGYQVEAAGTHDQFFPGWVMPEWMKAHPEVKAAVERMAQAAGKRLEDGVLRGDMTELAQGVSHDPDESASEWEADD
ncbi:eCIS core domain-containing protein [Streptomyces sp. CB02400]|uniref:eCIS core domain-containing protein n=1 Tax=Streptomyces sp. CB02400 TaxID=1703944 RepID=UPI000AE5FBC9